MLLGGVVLVENGEILLPQVVEPPTEIDERRLVRVGNFGRHTKVWQWHILGSRLLKPIWGNVNTVGQVSPTPHVTHRSCPRTTQTCQSSHIRRHGHLID